MVRDVRNKRGRKLFFRMVTEPQTRKVKRPSGRSAGGRPRMAALLFSCVALFFIAAFGMQVLMRPAVEKSVGGPWSLTDTNGTLVTQSTFQGRYTLLYFGYTHCPDICPVTLGTVAAALDMAGSRGRLVQPIFISVDPQRDSLSVIKDYVERFSPRIIGLTGTPDQVASMESAFHVEVEVKPALSSDKAMYMVNHTSALFLMDGKNHLVRMFSTDASAKEIARELVQVLPAS